MNWLQARATSAPKVESRFSFDEWLKLVSDPLGGLRLTMGSDKVETIGHSFQGYIEGALHSNGVIFALEAVRYLLFSEARFQFRSRRGGRPGQLFGNATLGALERPWAGGTTGDLLARMLLDADFGGNSYEVIWEGETVRLRPDKVDIFLEPRIGPGGHTLGFKRAGYAYRETPNAQPSIFLPHEISHFAPYPDPLASWRGMSWLTPIVREIQADGGMTKHKLRFLENSATPNLAVKLPKEVSPDDFEAWKAKMSQEHRGVDNAGKTLFVGGGADVTVVGKDLKELDFKSVQGAGESRMAAAAGIHPAIAGLSEGLSGSSLSDGNYRAAKRRVADGTLRPLWRNVCGSLATLVPPPPDAELWFDASDIAFLRDDGGDAADIRQKDSSAINTLINAGFDADAVIDAVSAGDLARLKGQHTGLVSVQLQKPGAGAAAA